MATITSLGDVWTTTAGSKTVTATPAVGDLIVIITANSGDVAATAVSDNNSDLVGTYTEVTSALSRASADSIQVWVRNFPINSATSTVFTMPGTNSTGGGGIVYKVASLGMNYGLAAIRQSAITSNGTLGTTPAPVMSNAVLTGNPVIMALMNATSPGGTTVRSSPAYTNDMNLGYATPTSGMVSSHVNSGETGTTLTWGGTSATAFGVVAIEIDAATPTPVIANLQQYDSDGVTPMPVGAQSITGSASGINLEFDMVPYKETLGWDKLQPSFEVKPLGTNFTNTATNTPVDPMYNPDGPIPTRGAGFCYDTTLKRFLMFGGANGATEYATVAELKFIGGKAKWRMLHPTGTAPSGRYQGAAVYDANNNRMLTVFGYTTTDTNEIWSLSFASSSDGAWTQLTPTGTAPIARSNITMSTCNDPTNHCFYVGMGWGASYYNGIYKLDYSTTAGAWTTLGAEGATGAPSVRRNACMILDSVNSRLLVFGGNASGTACQNDLHAFALSGNTWSTLSPSGGPPSIRERAWICYDPNTKLAYMGMGDNNNTAAPIQDYWKLDTTTTNCAWTEKDPVATSAGYMPTGTYLANAQFDPNQKYIIIYNGGVDPGGDLEKAPQIIDTTETTPVLYNAPMNDFMRPMDASNPMFNSDTGEALTFGGYSQMNDNTTIINGGHINDIFAYTYSTNSWRVATKGFKGFMMREGVMTVYDTIGQRFISFGGLWGEGGTIGVGTFNDVWEIKRDSNGNYAYRLMSPTGTPAPARWLGAAAFDATNNRIIYTLGSNAGTANYNDLHALNLSGGGDGAWVSLTPTGTPPTAAWGVGFTNDSANKILYVFGGATSTGDTAWSNQFLSLNYSTTNCVWATLSSTSAPTARRSGTLALDHANNKIIHFGGYNGTVVEQDIDFYDIAATTWSGAATPATSPGARRSHGAWYDTTNSAMLITHGRTVASAWWGDTWKLVPNYTTPSSSTWTNLNPTHYIRGYAQITSLANSTSYHWQAWTTDASATVNSGFTSYGGNAESATDFSLANSVLFINRDPSVYQDGPGVKIV